MVNQELLIHSAQEYYQYLQDNQLGVEELRIKSKIPTLAGITIYLGQKIFGLDGLLVRFMQQDYAIGEEESIKVETYDEKGAILVLHIAEAQLLEQIHQNAHQLTLITDLKFLVANTRDFFAHFAIHLPSTPQQPLTPEELPTDRLSIEQQKAIGKIFSAPLSYIWGAPGTGKTQRVLFESVLILIKRQKKIAIIAPTNHALEQALKTIIKKADDLQISRNLFLRFGIPSLEFLSHFPEVCDSGSIRQDQLSLFTYNNSKDRIKEAKVFAMTLDGFIKRYANLKCQFDHIFLDECAFAPLIKAVSLCANSSPITMLGDHKQLMPVCEASPKDLELHPKIKLWNLNALFLETLFTHNQDEILNQKQLHFQHTQTSILRHTYRYGKNLAQILNDYIYHNKLSGEGHSQIWLCDTARFLDTQELSAANTPPSKHTNPQEALAVKKLLHKLRGDYAIITPFVKQRQLLIQHSVHYERIFTIHKSQGQEFDCVIFSPVQLHYHLTDSANPQALNALNVAISRVKKHLILVCDAKQWQQMPQQFITALINEAIKNHTIITPDLSLDF
ncbi:hypothetical protein BBW65_06750 [Helicobacter enhydrae]|uniref:DNA2/NAM7 helicase-like C-terminal domain-containing protein n=1 Tax=Helicobacter enhydrae TaxID=222136 RepID=A0A1B1U6W7_9HELI|nr:DEAD/DEAH box helicase [Helicobacter enhydrae]ANV98509.1 hypothetical protein BBW65_06750 [Helicobacter enhydrae]